MILLIAYKTNEAPEEYHFQDVNQAYEMRAELRLEGFNVEIVEQE